MDEKLADLIKQSEQGDQVAQINLFFKQYHDYARVQAAIRTCDKWRENNLFLEGVWIFHEFKRPNFPNENYIESEYMNDIDSSKIFETTY